jgi:hypothetical protein
VSWQTLEKCVHPTEEGGGKVESPANTSSNGPPVVDDRVAAQEDHKKLLPNKDKQTVLTNKEEQPIVTSTITIMSTEFGNRGNDSFVDGAGFTTGIGNDRFGGAGGVAAPAYPVVDRGSDVSSAASNALISVSDVWPNDWQKSTNNSFNGSINGMSNQVKREVDNEIEFIYQECKEVETEMGGISRPVDLMQQ